MQNLDLAFVMQHIRHAAARCMQRAQDISQPVILRLHTAVESASDPFCVWQLANHPDDTPFVAWNDGQTGLCAVGWGSIGQQHRLHDGAQRFETAQMVCAKWLEQVVDVWLVDNSQKDTDIPLAFAAFSFSTDMQDTVWADWAHGLLYLPRILVYQHRAQPLGIVLSVMITQDTDVSHLDTMAIALCNTLSVLSNHAHQDSVQHDDWQHITTQHPIEIPSVADVFTKNIHQAVHSMQAGHFDKVVLSRTVDFVAPAQSMFSVPQTLFALRAQNPLHTTFAMSQGLAGAQRCFLGATPETLLRVSGRNVHTEAVAGTMPREAAADTLLRHQKNRFEHALVVDALQRALQPFCLLLEYQDKPEVMLLPHMQHLKTPFAGVLREAGGILNLIQALHPTPAVCGMPQAAAQHFLQTHEAFCRGLYAGPIGWFNAAGDGVFAVALRSMLMDAYNVRAFVGAGIVENSQADDEWHETMLKIQTVKSALQVIAS